MKPPVDSKFRFRKKKPQNQKTGEKCPACKIGELLIKSGKWGMFKGCSRFPECRYVESAKGHLEREADRILKNAGYGDLVM